MIRKATASHAVKNKNLDTGLSCLINIGLFHGVRIDANQLRHSLAVGDNKFTALNIVQGAKEYKLKSKTSIVKFNLLQKLPTPFIVENKDSRFIIVLSVDTKSKHVLCLDPADNLPKKVKFNDFREKWSGRVVLIARRFWSDNNRKFGIKWFLPTILKYKKSLIEVLTATLFLQFLGLMAPFMTQVVIDKALTYGSVATLDVLMIGLVSVAVFEALMSVAKNYIFTHTASQIDVILGARLFRHLFSLPLRYFETRRTGDTVARVMELEKIRHFLTGAPLTSVIDFCFVMVYVLVMFAYSSTLSWLVLASLPFFIALSLIVTPLLRSRLENKFNAGAESHSALVENINGAQTIKSFAMEPVLQKKWEDLSANYAVANYKMSILSSNAGAVGQLIQKVADVAILWVGAHMVMSGKMTIGALIAFRMLSSRVSGPILRLVQNWQELQQVGVSMKRIGDIFNSKSEIIASSQKTKMSYVKGKIEFDKVNFRYSLGDNQVIKNMSFLIEPGQVIGVVGRSGSGKSTISKLIQRLYIPESGRVKIDDLDIVLADLSWIRRQVGIVMQESFMFNLSIRDNIAIGNPIASFEDVVEVAKTAGAHDFIMDLPEGYDTVIGERGAGLSGGQKQRLAIARALLYNPAILIFDEATSALDYESENIIQNNLKKITAGRTVLIIAHRLSTLREVDKIMVIDKGEVVEFDKPEVLLKKNGLFKHLHDQQEKGDV